MGGHFVDLLFTVHVGVEQAGTSSVVFDQNMGTGPDTRRPWWWKTQNTTGLGRQAVRVGWRKRTEGREKQNPTHTIQAEMHDSNAHKKDISLSLVIWSGIGRVYRIAFAYRGRSHPRCIVCVCRSAKRSTGSTVCTVP